MKSASIHSGFVIPEKAGIQVPGLTEFRVKPGMTIVGCALNTLVMEPVMAEKVEFA